MANLYVEWDTTNNEVVDAYQVHMSPTSDYQPSSSTLLGEVASTVNVFEGVIPDGTWYFRVMGYNEFSQFVTPVVERTIDCSDVAGLDDGIIAVAYAP